MVELRNPILEDRQYLTESSIFFSSMMYQITDRPEQESAFLTQFSQKLTPSNIHLSRSLVDR